MMDAGCDWLHMGTSIELAHTLSHALLVSQDPTPPLARADLTDVMDGFVAFRWAPDQATDQQSFRAKPNDGSTYLGTRPQEHPRAVYGLSYDGIGPGPSKPTTDRHCLIVADLEVGSRDQEGRWIKLYLSL